MSSGTASSVTADVLRRRVGPGGDDSADRGREVIVCAVLPAALAGGAVTIAHAVGGAQLPRCADRRKQRSERRIFGPVDVAGKEFIDVTAGELANKPGDAVFRHADAGLAEALPTGSHIRVAPRRRSARSSVSATSAPLA